MSVTPLICFFRKIYAFYDNIPIEFYDFNLTQRRLSTKSSRYCALPETGARRDRTWEPRFLSCPDFRVPFVCGAMALIFPRVPRFEGAPVFGSGLYIGNYKSHNNGLGRHMLVKSAFGWSLGLYESVMIATSQFLSGTEDRD